MSSDDRPAPPLPSGPAVPRWQRVLVRWLGPAVCGVALNQLADIVPYLAVAVTSVVLAVVVGLSRLDRTAPLVRGLPRFLLRVIAAGVLAAMVLPESWAGPVIGSLTGLIVLALLLTPQRGAALATLVGISVFTYGVVLAFTAAQERFHAVVTTTLVGCGGLLAVGGLSMLNHPERFIRSGLTMATVRGLRRWTTEGNGFGVLAAVGGFVLMAGIGLLGTDGHGPVTVAAAGLLMIAGLAVIGAEAVLWPAQLRGPLFGVLLVVAGMSLTVLSALIGFAGTGRELVAVPILGTFGLAVTGAGISLLDDTGTLARLRRRLTYLVHPDPG